MKFYSIETIASILDYDGFIPFLKKAFQTSIETPNRLHYELPKGTALMMPAWNNHYLGIKIVTVHSQNATLKLPSIHANYVLQSAETGEPFGIFEGKTLTSKRTAAASALASSFLSRKDSSKLLMVGNGALAPELIRAHATVRPIEEVKIWGRNPQKVQHFIDSHDWKSLEVSFANDLNAAVTWADIVSCATLSETPLILGKYLKAGQHIDLVGSYQAHTREADDAVMAQASIFVDTFLAMQESGDLVIPLKNGIITEKNILSDLKTLSEQNNFRRENDNEITLFKSVGLALEDLAAAIYIIQNTINQ